MEPCGLFEEKLSLCIDNVFMSLGKKMNFSVIFSVSNRSVSSSCPAVLPHRKRFTGGQETRRCWCDCLVTESQRKGEVGDTNASNKHTEMERLKSQLRSF